MVKKEKPFKLESDLCAAFIKALPAGWTAYPETAGWDILLVRGADGFQIGIQAKLRLNAIVVTQAIDGYYGRTKGPDVRAVLVPDAGSGGLAQICKWLGIVVITVRREQPSWADKVYTYVFPELPKLASRNQWTATYQGRDWPETGYIERETLPEYVPDVAAGAAAPTQLTAWKIGAIKLAILLQRQGFLTRADFKALRVDERRWLPSSNGWLLLDPQQRGRYLKAPNFPEFRRQHPTNWAQIEADFEKWAPKPEGLL